ncbi:zinc finger MYM-type protein 1-like [Corticium candelabrum]|uniref:zinc finger MYM-type protein 1-like n=1 Tax=Corticium candelabrum TaxID=121492 RepID=UPI002E2691C9|nr:zinc finger MYM-type protein 1-like [Corticium candelabrum]
MEPPSKRKKKKQLSLLQCLGTSSGDLSDLPETVHSASPFDTVVNSAEGRVVSDVDKICLLQNKWCPPTGCKFQSTGGRRYNPEWESQYRWLRYSPSTDACFCCYCVLFGDESLSATAFKTTGFCDWKNAVGVKRGVLLCHEKSEIHKNACIKALSFKNVVEGKKNDICTSRSKEYEERVKRNRAIILAVIDVVIALGQRNVPFRGHSWDKVLRKESSNFEYFLHWQSQFNPTLKSHLEHGKKNACYKSPKIQNELIELAGVEVRDKILEDAHAAKWFSLMADECTDTANVEQMSVCIRFVDDSVPGQVQVREEFLGFVKLDCADALSIFNAIVNFMKECNLDIRYLRGQGYDGAAVMSGKVSGVSARILQLQPKAIYQHCRSHRLNLVIASSCRQVPLIQDLFNSLGTLTWFLGGSPKRKVILCRHLIAGDIAELITAEDKEEEEPEEELEENLEQEETSKLSDTLIRKSSARQVPVLCETRWSARLARLSSVLAKYKAIYLALQDIVAESSGTDSRAKASSYLRLLQSSSFIVCLVVSQYILSFCDPLTKSLQSPHCDVLKAYQTAKLLRTTISAQRREDKFKELWERVQTVAGEVDAQIDKPRTAIRSTYRSNAGMQTAEQDSAVAYFRRNVYYPFIDHAVTELNNRFPDTSESMLIGYRLLPSSVSSITRSEVNSIKLFYGPDLPNGATFEPEVEVWKTKCFQLPEKDRRVTLTDAAKMADSQYFPNIHEIFKLILTSPVGSVPCERSFSALRRLKEWSRSTMTQERLCGLALLYIHRDVAVSRENVLQRFDCTGHRRLGQLSL